MSDSRGARDFESIEKFYDNLIKVLGIQLNNWPFSKRYYVYKLLQTMGKLEIWDQCEKISQDPTPRITNYKEYDEQWKKVWDQIKNN